MEKELIAENTDGNLSLLVSYDVNYSEGDTGEVRFYMDKELAPEEITELESSILAGGAYLTGPIVQDARILVIPFRVAAWPLFIIGPIVAIVGGIIGWQLFKDKIVGFIAAPFGVPLWVWVLGVGSVVALYFLTRGKEVAPAGKPIVQKFFLGKGE